MAGAAPWCSQAEGIGVVQPGEEKTLGKAYRGPPVPEEGLQESCGRGTFCVVTGQGGMVLS